MQLSFFYNRVMEMVMKMDMEIDIEMVMEMDMEIDIEMVMEMDGR